MQIRLGGIGARKEGDSVGQAGRSDCRGTVLCSEEEKDLDMLYVEFHPMELSELYSIVWSIVVKA